mgnify:CR=1 FL=1
MNWKEILRPNLFNVLITLILIVLTAISGFCSIDNALMCFKIDLGGVYIDPAVGTGPPPAGRQWGYNPLQWNVPSILTLIIFYLISAITIWLYKTQKK